MDAENNERPPQSTVSKAIDNIGLYKQMLKQENLIIIRSRWISRKPQGYMSSRLL